ncbi:MAG: methyltransferase domain-containing protein [Deltaproteobacteria bacterium]|nr:methyltransferase domain-containing protein [Deltaproteobacteria bacterium]
MKNHTCPWWLAYTFDHRLRRLIHNPERLLGGQIRPGMTVLDLGCGMGFFSIAMAGLVGPEGRVISVDVQPDMLRVLLSRAKRAGLADRIQPHLGRPDQLGLTAKADFALAFWMAHEINDRTAFFDQVRGCLRDGSRLLVVEPVIHVTSRDFRIVMDSIIAAGFVPSDQPRIRLSRAGLFEVI